jgi:hypothetical protein
MQANEIIIQLLVFIAGLLSTYIGITNRLSKVETEIKWLKEVITNKKNKE